MGDEPGRLVDDGEVGVLMDDGKRHRVGRKGGVAFQRLHALRPDLVLQPPEAWLAEMDLGDWEGRLWADDS